MLLFAPTVASVASNTQGLMRLVRDYGLRSSGAPFSKCSNTYRCKTSDPMTLAASVQHAILHACHLYVDETLLDQESMSEQLAQAAFAVLQQFKGDGTESPACVGNASDEDTYPLGTDKVTKTLKEGRRV